MPNTTIPNVAGAFGNAVSAQSQEVVEMVNTSAAIRTVGDVVITLDGVSATTTTTLNDKAVIGVVAPSPSGGTGTTAQTFPIGALMPVVVRGPARVNVGANTPAARDLLTPDTNAGTAITNATALGVNAVIGSILGVCMVATKDANNCLLAWICKA